MSGKEVGQNIHYQEVGVIKDHCRIPSSLLEFQSRNANGNKQDITWLMVVDMATV